MKTESNIIQEWNKELDFYSLEYDDPEVYDLISKGDAIGLFQVEGFTGREWAARVKPSTLSEISGLISIIRPGVLKAIEEGKSLAQHYVDRKHKQEEIKYIHSALEDILKDTYGILTYQEQSILIVQKLAGFSLAEADILRRAVGKKDAALMTKVEGKFIDGCKKVGIVDDKTAKEIFGWIRRGERYGFNKSVVNDLTVVTDKNEIKTLEQIQIGEKINTPEGFVEVLEKYDHGELEVYELTLDNGSQIKCTINHKFLCSDGQIRPLHEIISLGLYIMVYSD